jgi:hypothetical protein
MNGESGIAATLCSRINRIANSRRVRSVIAE